MKFHGIIGFSSDEETSPGVWEEVITEKPYSCEVVRNGRRNQNGESVNDDVTSVMEVSITMDPYANGYFHNMKYIKNGNVKWKITNVECRYPRLILTTGGVYNND